MRSLSYGPSIRWMDAPNTRVVKVHHDNDKQRSSRWCFFDLFKRFSSFSSRPRPHYHGHGYHPVILEIGVLDERVNWLKDRLNLKENEAKKITQKEPTILGMKPSSLGLKLDYLKSRLLLDDMSLRGSWYCVPHVYSDWVSKTILSLNWITCNRSFSSMMWHWRNWSYVQIYLLWAQKKTLNQSLIGCKAG